MTPKMLRVNFLLPAAPGGVCDCCGGVNTQKLLLPCGHTACRWCAAVVAVGSHRSSAPLKCETCGATTLRAAAITAQPQPHGL